MTEEEKVKFYEALINWYQENKRDLPWRKDKDSYHVWISEIMLQQTRVEAVIPYYEKFLKTFPTLESLACAKEDVLLKLWEGLGYYSRVRNLQKCAKLLVDNGFSHLPDSYEELLKLPGIGEYTAAAIASICYNKKTPAIDGNVLRVMTRILKDDRDILKQQTKKYYFSYLQDLMGDDTSSFTQGLMEVGAKVCVPNGIPYCDLCPFSSLCKGRKDKSMMAYPYKGKKIERKIEKRTVFLLEMDGKIYLRKRPSTGLLAKLYEYPSVYGYLSEKQIRECIPVKIDEIIKVGLSRHIFSHIEWHMTGYFIRLSKTKVKKDDLFLEWSDIKKNYSIPSAFRFYTNFLDKFFSTHP